MQVCRLSLLLLSALSCLALSSCSSSEEDISLQGAGATFPAPLYKRWFLEYYKAHPEIRVNYQAIGSGAGIRQFTAGLSHFGASDAAMSDAQIAEVPTGVQLLPLTAGSVVLGYNVPGVPQALKLPRQALAGIVLGDVTTWNDRAIADANPGVVLPEMDITFVRRAEGSGTTYVFTKHLSAISKKWQGGPGVSVVWPVGVGAKGTSGVAALIQQTPGAIGYVEFGYADLVKLPMAHLQNKAGNYVPPSTHSCKIALAEARLPDNGDLRLWVSDPEGKDSYPIVTYTWLLCRKKYSDPRTAQALKKVIRYCLTDGQKISADLGYVPLPENIAARALKALDAISP